MPGPRSPTTREGTVVEGGDGDLAAGGGVPEGVLDEVGEGEGEELVVALDDEAGGGVAGDAEAALLGGGLVELADVGSEAAEVDLRELLGADAGIDPRDVEQRGGGGEDALGLAQGLLDAGLLLVGGDVVVGGGLEVADQASEGAAQVVGEAVGDGAQVANEDLDAVEHGVEGAGETVELVAGAAERDAAVEGAGHDGAGGAVDLADAAGDEAREQPAGGERERGDRGEGRSGAHARVESKAERASTSRPTRRSSFWGRRRVRAEMPVGRLRSVR